MSAFGLGKGEVIGALLDVEAEFVSLPLQDLREQVTLVITVAIKPHDDEEKQEHGEGEPHPEFSRVERHVEVVYRRRPRIFMDPNGSRVRTTIPSSMICRRRL